MSDHDANNDDAGQSKSGTSDAHDGGIHEASKHKKPIAALGSGIKLLEGIDLPAIEVSDGGLLSDQGVVTSRDGADLDAVTEQFRAAIKAHHHWDREEKSVPA